MDFIENIKNSVYNPTFYRNIPKESFGAAFRYYLLLCLLVTFFRLVFLSFPVATNVTSAVQAGTQGLLTNYPGNLEVTIHQGKLSVNQPLPYIFPICFKDAACQNIIIDTNKPDVETYLKQKNLFMLLTQEKAYIKGSTSDTRIYDLSQMGDMEINRPIVTNFVHAISPWTKFFVPFALLFIGIMLYIGFLFKLVYLLFLALILWLLARKFVPGITYSQSYKISLHVVTLGILAALVLDVTSWFFHIYSFPFMETIFSILVFLINFNTAGKKETKKSSVPSKTKKRK